MIESRYLQVEDCQKILLNQTLYEKMAELNLLRLLSEADESVNKKDVQYV